MILRARVAGAVLAAVMMAVLGATGECHAESWPLWTAYKNAFVDKDGRVIDYQMQGRTTSEGEAYALFFSLVANDHAEFVKILSWTQNNLSQGDLSKHLPAWEWGKHQNGSWSVLDSNSAADADLWISYTLLEAGRLWHEPSYTALGMRIVKQINREEVADLPGFGPMLLPGRKGFHRGTDQWLLNPSYVPLPLVEAMAHVDPSGPWRVMASHFPAFVKAASPNGFCLDWVSYSPRSGFDPAVLPGSSKIVPRGSFDAIRVYLWAGMTSPATPGYRQVLAALWGMSRYLKFHEAPPESVSSEGHILQPDGPAGFSAAVGPYLKALGRTRALAIQQSRLAGSVNPKNKLYGKPSRYYDQNLALFAEGWLEHRFGLSGNGNLWVKWNRK